MISQIMQTYQLDGEKPVAVDLTNIPQLSEKSQNLLGSALNMILFPDPLCGIQQGNENDKNSLEGRITSLEAMTKSLTATKENRVLYKATALLQTAFLAAVVAASIIASLSSSPALAACGIVGGSILYLALAHVLSGYALSEMANIDGELSSSSFAPILSSTSAAPYMNPSVLASVFGGGFILPLYEAFTRESRLENTIEKLKEIITPKLDALQKENQSKLSDICSFYIANYGKLTWIFTDQIQKKQQTINFLTNQSTKDENRIAKLNEEISSLRDAENEVLKSADFYLQFI